MTIPNTTEAVARARAAVDACGLCGHERAEACGFGMADDIYLCHADDHSCYHRWTVYGVRPSVDGKPVPDLMADLEKSFGDAKRKQQS